MPCISEFEFAVNVIKQGCSWRMEGTVDLDSHKDPTLKVFLAAVVLWVTLSLMEVSCS